MKTFSHKLLICLGLLFSGLSLSAHADSIYKLSAVQSSDGYITQQPTISAYQLERVLEDADSYLQGKQSNLEQKVSKHKDAGENVILAAIMPGGLLYMAYHKGQQSSAEGKLVLVKQDQQEIINDRTRLQLDAPTIIQVARFP